MGMVYCQTLGAQTAHGSEHEVRIFDEYLVLFLLFGVDMRRALLPGRMSRSSLSFYASHQRRCIIVYTVVVEAHVVFEAL